MNFLGILSVVHAGYRTYRTIRQSWDALQDLTEVFNAFVSGNLNYNNRDWLLGLLKRNLRRLWDLVAPRYFRELHSWHTTYCLVRDCWHSIRDVYYVSNVWLGLTYGDRDRMRSLQRQNFRRVVDFAGPRCMFCLRTIRAYS